MGGCTPKNLDSPFETDLDFRDRFASVKTIVQPRKYETLYALVILFEYEPLKDGRGCLVYATMDTFR